MTNEQLVAQAMDAMHRAYAPYSGFFVGAALLTRRGMVYAGCNVENAALSPGICAERNVFSTAVADGARDFEKIAIVGGARGRINGSCAPCGVCRQVMREFCGDDFEIILYDGKETTIYTLGQLLPLGFSASALGGGKA